MRACEGGVTNHRPSKFVMMVVGDPEKGLVGIGRGRGVETATAMDQAFNHGE